MLRNLPLIVCCWIKLCGLFAHEAVLSKLESMYPPAFFQIWWWLHSDCPGRWLSPCAEASWGFHPAEVPRQRPEGEASQHTAVSAPVHAGSVGQDFQAVHQASAEAGHRGLLCVPDHPGSGEAPNMGEWKKSGFFFQTWIWKVPMDQKRHLELFKRRVEPVNC